MTDGRITDKAPYGAHIMLTCKQHPTLRWSTKNITPIGCRTLFYNLYNDPDMEAECECPISDLGVVA